MLPSAFSFNTPPPSTHFYPPPLHPSLPSPYPSLRASLFSPYPSLHPSLPSPYPSLPPFSTLPLPLSPSFSTPFPTPPLLYPSPNPLSALLYPTPTLLPSLSTLPLHLSPPFITLRLPSLHPLYYLPRSFFPSLSLEYCIRLSSSPSLSHFLSRPILFLCTANKIRFKYFQR